MTNHPNRSGKRAYVQGTMIRETLKGVLLRCKMERGDEPVSAEVWFPKSEIQDVADANADLPEAVRAVVEPARVYEMPEWLARDKGVCYGTRL